ncbi:MAG: hypothetical protein Q4G60_10600 [bacterium]|nr:hypothetical protein [bacterium]
MKCYKCNRSIESGLSFRPVDAAGTPGRRWICNECQGIKEETVESVIQEAIMTDQERAIKVLRDWNDGCRDLGCEIHTDSISDAINVAIYALEKQIPNKVHMDKLGNDAACPICKTVLADDEIWSAKEHIIYCENCGQLIDWSVEE